MESRCPTSWQLIEQLTWLEAHFISSKVTVPRIKQLRQCQKGSLFMLACTGWLSLSAGEASGAGETAASAHVQFKLHMQSKLCSSCCISTKLMTIGQRGKEASTTSSFKQLNYRRRMLIFNYTPQSHTHQSHTRPKSESAKIYYNYKFNTIKHFALKSLP